MKVLVTGGSGYIGSHTVVELQQSGFEVVIFDNLSNSSISVLEGIASITGIKPLFEPIDLCDLPALQQGFARHPDISAVIHFAAFKAMTESIHKPLQYYHNNLVSLINLLQIMEANRIERLVFSSSCTVYGHPVSIPVTENTPKSKALTPYGSTKQMAEEILQDICRSSSLKVMSLRYFNPIGAHPSIQLGESPLGIPNNLIPYITQTATGKLQQLSVFGKDYSTPDGTCIRDYIHVVDLAKAHLTALGLLLHNQESGFFKALNLGVGKGYSVLEIIQTFEKTCNVKINYCFAERRPGDTDEIWADNLAAIEQLNWQPQFNLEDMLLSAWNWEQQQSRMTQQNQDLSPLDTETN